MKPSEKTETHKNIQQEEKIKDYQANFSLETVPSELGRSNTTQQNTYKHAYTF